MKKQLPKIKKTVSSFVTGEDAKVMSKSATKISLSVVAASSIVLFQAETGYASHNVNHTNSIRVHLVDERGFIPPSEPETNSQQKGGGFTLPYFLYIDGFNQKPSLFDVNNNEVRNSHLNHQNHSNSSRW